jgi:hypothetical protein
MREALYTKGEYLGAHATRLTQRHPQASQWERMFKQYSRTIPTWFAFCIPCTLKLRRLFVPGRGSADGVGMSASRKKAALLKSRRMATTTTSRLRQYLCRLRHLRAHALVSAALTRIRGATSVQIIHAAEVAWTARLSCHSCDNHPSRYRGSEAVIG